MNKVSNTWQKNLIAFFDERSNEVSGVPSIQDLCYISGRDSRLWTDPEMLADLSDDILRLMEVDKQSNVLEVGSAAGFLANLIAPKVHLYHGVDISKSAIKAANRLELSNAEFKHIKGKRLPFKNGSYDAAYCYDVFTNLPSVFDGEFIISEMLRVVKPGGKIVVGSIPDDATKDDYPEKIIEVNNWLEKKYGPPQEYVHANPREIKHTSKYSFLAKWFEKLSILKNKVVPEIICFYFSKEDFRIIGKRLNAKVEFTDIHLKNPYLGFRYNVIFLKLD